MRNSKFKLTDSTLDKLFDLLFELVGKSNNRNSFKKIIFDLLSKEERTMVFKRIAIMYLLLKEIDYRTISKILKVSQATISKFSILLEKSEGLIPTFRKILRKEKVSLFIEKMFLELYPPGTPYTNWRAAWRRKTQYEAKRTKGL